jgi:DNA-binding response OmpR family regulator
MWQPTQGSAIAIGGSAPQNQATTATAHRRVRVRVRNMADAKKIVLIEDDREISTTIHGVLQAAGYDVSVANNGLEGQNLIKTCSPDLVITDMMMPRMGGFPTLEFIKEMENPPRVIMITANEGGRHKAYAEMLGVDDYLHKPFAMDLLLDAISRILSPTKTKKSAATGKLKRSTKKKTAE